jgi:hypothetical protein
MHSKKKNETEEDNTSILYVRGVSEKIKRSHNISTGKNTQIPPHHARYVAKAQNTSNRCKRNCVPHPLYATGCGCSYIGVIILQNAQCMTKGTSMLLLNHRNWLKHSMPLRRITG